MISRQDLRQLLSHEIDPKSPVLSVYLDVDQGRAVNLNRGFEAALKSLLKTFEQSLESDSERAEFSQDAAHATAFLAEFQPEGKSLVLFCDVSREFFWNRSLDVSLENKVSWAPRPNLRLLLEARDEFERYGVILTDRARARLFTVFLNSIEEHLEAFAEADVKKFDASGTDQMRSQMVFQRRAHEHARWHLKHVADLVDRIPAAKRFDRLVLGGTHEVLGELKGLLSDRLKKSVIGSVTLPVDASPSEILEETVRVEKEVERDGENGLVRKLLTDSAKNNQAVTGILATLEALNSGRVRQLIYSGGWQTGGVECWECGYLSDREGDVCPSCGGSFRRLDDLIEAAAVRVFREGGQIEHLRLKAASELEEKGGGIGAYLRF